MLLRVLVVILVVGALVAGGLFLRDYFDQTNAQEGLETQINSTNDTISKVTSQTKDIQTELAALVKKSNDTQASLEAQKNTMPEKVNPNAVVESVMLLGLECKVRVIPLSTQDWTSVKIGEGTYSVFKMKLDVEGSEFNVIDFVEKMQYQLYDNLAIESLSLTKTVTTPTPIQTATPTPTITPVPEVSVSASLTFALYAK